MKVLTVNFLTCAVKTCKTSPLSYPLHFRDAELEQQDMEFNPTFIRNIMPRIEWEALKVTAIELGFNNLPAEKPDLPAASQPSETSPSDPTDAPEPSSDDQTILQDLHKLLLETQVVEGKLVCGNCSHEYKIKEGIANFLLPNHLV
ncbi:hypothetical protein MMC14_007996 [Varicellaria rhodocarpa]|nr:hypothetical protein [Varicellaria rhodocarpa]